MKNVPVGVVAIFLCALALPRVLYAGTLDAVMEYKRQQQRQQAQQAQAFPNAVNAFIAGRQQAIENQQAMLALQIQMAEAEQERQNQIAAIRAEAQRQKNAILQALSSPLKAQALLMEGIRLYIDALSKNKTHYFFDWVLWTDMSNEMYQAESHFKQNANNLNSYWVDAPLTGAIKTDYLNAFQQLGEAMGYEIQGFKAGCLFWIAEEQFQRGRAAKILALKSAISAIQALRHTIALEIGVELDSDLIRTLERDADTLTKLLAHWRNKEPQSTSESKTAPASQPAAEKMLVETAV